MRNTTWNAIGRLTKFLKNFIPRSPVILFLLAAICVLAILTSSWGILVQKGSDILVEVCGFFFDIILFGIILTIYSNWLERRKKILSYYDQLDDFRSWRGEEGILRKVGIIRRLIGMGAKLPNLSHFHLKGADLGGLDLSCVNFSSTNLARAKLGGSKLDNANLSGSILRGAYFAGTSLTGANLLWANLEGAHLGGAEIMGVDLSEVKRLSLRQITGSGNWSGANYDEDTILPLSMINKNADERDRAQKMICSTVACMKGEFHIDSLYWFLKREKHANFDYNTYLAAIFILEKNGLISRAAAGYIEVDEP